MDKEQVRESLLEMLASELGEEFEAIDSPRSFHFVSKTTVDDKSTTPMYEVHFPTTVLNDGNSGTHKAQKWIRSNPLQVGKTHSFDAVGHIQTED